MTGTAQLARAGYGLLKKEATLLVRYPLNTLAYIALMYFIFLMIFVGGLAFGGEQFDNTLGAIIVAYFLVSMSNTAFTEVASTFSREASWGTLEQMYMTRLGFGRITLLVAAAQMILSLFWGGSVLVLMLLTTGRTVSIDVVSVLPVLFFALLPIVGLGLVMGGAAVLYKRLGNIFSLVQFVFYGLVAAPVEQYPALKLLPLAQGSYVLRLVMNQNTPIWAVPRVEIGILVAVGVVYLVCGYALLGRIVDTAKQRGVMGDY